jgi:hypothetical protein
MCRPRRRFDFSEKCGSRGCQFAQPRTAVLIIDGPFDQIAGGQSFERAGCRGSVECDIGCQSCLVGGLPRCKRGKQAVLQRGDFELAAGFLEQCDMYLMQSPDQKSRPLWQWPRPVPDFTTTLCCFPQRTLLSWNLSAIARLESQRYLK